MAANFIPQKYWEDRLREKYSLAGAGDLTKIWPANCKKLAPEEVNCVARCLDGLPIRLNDCSLL